MTTAQSLSVDAYNLLLEALIEYGYNVSDLQDYRLYYCAAAISLSSSVVVSVAYTEDNEAVFVFNGEYKENYKTYSFDGTYNGLIDVIDCLHEEGYYLP